MSIRVMTWNVQMITAVDALGGIGPVSDNEAEVRALRVGSVLRRMTGQERPDIIAFNERHRDRELPFFGQETMIKARDKGPLTEPEYLDAVAKSKRLAGKEGIDAVMDQHRLDALIAPTSGPAGTIDYLYGDRGEGGSSSPAAVAGYPSITVPAGEHAGLPIGLSFLGRAWSEGTLIKLAYAFEQRTHARRKPRFRPTLSAG